MQMDEEDMLWIKNEIKRAIETPTFHPHDMRQLIDRLEIDVKKDPYSGTMSFSIMDSGTGYRKSFHFNMS